MRSADRQAMAEKDRLLRELDLCKQQLNIGRDDVLNVSETALGGRKRHDEELQVHCLVIS